MNCPKCGCIVDDGVKTCPVCGAAVRRKAPGGSRKSLTVPVIAVILAVAMIASGAYLWTSRSRTPLGSGTRNSSGSQDENGGSAIADLNGTAGENVFALKLKSAREDTSSYDILNACSMMYDTLFETKGFAFHFTANEGGADEINVDGGFVFGSSLALSQALYDDGSVCVALRDGKLYLQTDETDAAGFDVSSLLSDAVGVVDAIPQTYLPAAAKMVLANNADVIRQQLNGLFCGRLDAMALDQLSDYLYRVLYLIESTRFAENIKMNDRILLQDVLNIAAEYVAQLPENVIEIEKSEENGEWHYAFHFRRTEFEKSVLNYILSSDTVGSLLTDVAQKKLEDRLDKLMPYDEKPIMGEIVIKNNYITKIAAGEDDKGVYSEIFCLTFEDMNGASAATAKLEELFDRVDEAEMPVVRTVDELKEWFTANGAAYDE